MYENVLDFVVSKHSGQVRKHSGLPYVFHPIEVTKKLTSLGINDEVTLKAALCHDILEDTGTGYTELASVIGVEAADIVEELTYRDTKYSSKEEYINSFKDKSIESLRIKIVDRYCNSVDYCESGNERYAYKYFNKAFWLIKYYLDKYYKEEEKFSRFVEFIDFHPHCFLDIDYG